MVLYIVHTARIGGAAESLYTFLKHRDPTRFSAIVWCGDNGEYVRRFRDLGLPTYVGKISSFENTSHFRVGWSSDAAYSILKCVGNLVPTLVWMIYFICFKKVSIVHINSSTPLLCGILARVFGVSVVWHVREIFPVSIWRRPQAWVIRHSARVIIAISPRVERDFVDKAREKVRTIYNPFDIIGDAGDEVRLRVRSRMGVSDEFVALYVGQVTREKGADLFVAMAERLCSSGGGVFWVVGGSPRGEPHWVKTFAKWTAALWGREARKLDELLGGRISERNLEGRIRLLGYRRDVNELLIAADVLVCPNRVEEAFGRVVVEAAVLGRCVLASRLASFVDILDEGQTGWLPDAGDVDGFVRRLEELRSCPEMRRSVGERARLELSRAFGTARHVDEVQKVYAEILSSRRGRV
jgi:glycosyltransferase involved in cell wall biosynthesis